ncbi:MAG: FecR domain-containing protein [Polyangiales bacterium]
MTPPRALGAAALAALVACRARHRPPPDEALADVAVADARADVADVAGEREAPLPRAEVTITEAVGDVRWDPNHRCAGLPRAAGGAVRGEVSLLCGDRVETAAGASARFELPGHNVATLGAASAAEVAGHAGAALVLLRGAIELSSPFEAERSLAVDTPAGRVIVSVGAARVAVAANGAVRVTSVEGAVTVWAGRPFVARSLSARASLVLPLPGAPVRGGVGLAAAFARAGEVDARDAREALTRLRAGQSGRDRDAAEGALSLALGRLHARARCAQALEAGALPGFEALRDEARAR